MNNTMNKLSGEIVELMSKMVTLKIHFGVSLQEEEHDLAIDLFYDMLDVKIKSGRKLVHMKVTVDIEPELLECEEMRGMLNRAEENYKMICEIYEDVAEVVINKLN